jgi:hypothetical protein
MIPAAQIRLTRPARLTSSFVLAAAITILFNTLLACAKDSYAPLNAYMKRLTGHHWTTHGLADLALFVGLGLIFLATGIGEKAPPNRLSGILAATVMVATSGLVLWYVFF